MPAVLVWSCGPVQDFIASARKGRDLWFGSWLLSELARAAALAVLDSCGDVKALVMPAPESRAALERDDFNTSNKLLVRTEADPAALAEAMSAAARARLAAIAEQALGQAAGDILRERAEAQIADLIEVSWGAADEAEAGGYAEARQLAEVLHAARKGDRPFSQPSWSGPAPKSSLDGARESVIPERVYEELRDRPERLRQRYGAGPAERLCGIGLLKRFGHRAATGRGGRIQSTSHVASWSTRRRLRSALHQDAFDEYIQALIGLEAELSEHPGRPEPVTGRWDCHMLYASRLGDIVPAEALGEAEQELDELFRAWGRASEEAGEEPPQRPTPYFAVLMADGDRLGQVLDGLHTPAAHRDATRQLEAFAREAERILARPEHGGQAVYTGGDDVLALLPARTALAAARELAEAFAALPIGEGVTLSAGICIGHHLDPLHRTLDAARGAEQYAKQVVKHDAWAVTLSKRGGSPVTLGGRWEELPELSELIALYESAGEGDRLPRGLAYDLRAAHLRLSDTDKARDQKLARLRELEGRRLLIQKGMRRAAEAPPPGSPAAVVERQFKGGDLLGLARRLELARALTAFDGGAA